MIRIVSVLGRKRSGFSLMEVMVGSAVGMILIMALIAALRNVQKGQSGAKTSLDFDILRQGLLGVLRNSTSCGQMFWTAGGAGRLAVPVPFSAGSKLAVPLLRSNGATLIDMSKPDVSPQLKLTSLDLEAKADATTEVLNGVTYQAQMTSLVVAAERKGEGFGRPKFEQSFDLKIFSNPTTGQIELCGGFDTSESSTVNKKGWPDDELTCAAGSLMIGAGPDGPICGSGQDDHLKFGETLPEGATPTRCLSQKNSNPGSRPKAYECNGNKKVKCSFTSGSQGDGWYFQKGKKSVPCTGGVDVQAPALGSIQVDGKGLLPSSVDQDDYEISCMNDKGIKTTLCGDVKNQFMNALPNNAEEGECYNINQKWEVVQPLNGNSGPKSNSCEKGLLLEPL
jgi:hypothetical protein